MQEEAEAIMDEEDKILNIRKTDKDITDEMI